MSRLGLGRHRGGRFGHGDGGLGAGARPRARGGRGLDGRGPVQQLPQTVADRRILEPRPLRGSARRQEVVGRRRGRGCGRHGRPS
eukprot:3972970-Pyramimonas_sp.AAC.1